jgi:hypothetical protein
MLLTWPHLPPRNALDGLLLLGGQHTVENLVAAYAKGIFRDRCRGGR